MKISIAMCTYDGGRYLREQLDSLASQRRLPDELIVSDDGSSDNTVMIIEEFSSSSPFPVHFSVNDTNLGTIKNSEKLVRACNGDVIVPCDQDDVWYSDKLESLEELFLSTPGVGLVFSDAELVDAALRPEGCSLFRRVGFGFPKQKLVKQGKALDVLMTQTVVCGATMAYRSTFKELILPIPANGPLIQDGWVALMIAAVADIAFIDKPLMKYRQHPTQQMGALKTSRLASVFRAERTDRSHYLSQAAQFNEAYDRLASYGGKARNESSLSMFRDKVIHLHARARMPIPRCKRVQAVLKEVSNLHYHRFSRGWFSVAKDLLM